MDVIPIVMALSSSVLAALMAFIASRKQKADTKKQKEHLNKIDEALRTSLAELFDNYFDKLGSQSSDYYNYINTLRNFLVHYQSLGTKADVEKQVNERVNELKKRIEAIEARFPPEATLEKIASVNDAILATQLEAVSSSIKTIQDNMLTKWDVVKIAFAILTALGVIAAIIFGILNLVKP